MSKSTKFEIAMEIIGQAIFDLFPRGERGRCVNQEDAESADAVSLFLQASSDGYLRIDPDDVEKYKQEPWFQKEAIMDLYSSDEKDERSHWFIPIKRILG